MQANEAQQGPSRDRRWHAPWEEVPAGAGAGATPAWGRSRDDWRSGVLSHRERRRPLTLDQSGRLRPADDDAWLQFSRQLTRWLDSSFQVPGTRLRFGWEPVIGLVPGIGDAVGAALSSVLLWTAYRLGVPRIVQVRMLVNVALDTAIGAIPLLGDPYDFFFRSNRRNLDLLERALAEPDRRGRVSDWAYVGLAAAGASLVLMGLVWLAVAVAGAALGALL